jgi:hypothetical protein
MSNYSTVSHSHDLQFITAHTKSSKSAVSSPVAGNGFQCHRSLSFHVHVLTGQQLSHHYLGVAMQWLTTTGNCLTTALDPCQRSHSWVRDPQDSWPYFTISESRLPQPGGPSPHLCSGNVCLGTPSWSNTVSPQLSYCGVMSRQTRLWCVLLLHISHGHVTW